MLHKKHEETKRKRHWGCYSVSWEFLDEPSKSQFPYGMHKYIHASSKEQAEHWLRTEQERPGDRVKVTKVLEVAEENCRMRLTR